MFVRVYASGTNVQRLAKCSNKIDGVIYSAYSQLEKNEPNIVKRKFFCTDITNLKKDVEQLNEEVMPSWTKIWGRPYANEAFIGSLLQCLTGSNELRSELNLSSMLGQAVDCFMLLVSANNAEMTQIKKIAERVIPDYAIKVLNGDFTTNNKAENETKREINEAKIAGKRGLIIIANQMGSRSYSIPEIQSTVIAFDRGSVDATAQKSSRCLTPGNCWDGTKKEYGAIVDLSFDPNRNENIEKIILEEAIQVQRSGDAEDFTKAVRYVLSSVNLMKMNEYGYPVEVTEEDLFKVFSDNEAMLRVADVAVDVEAIIDSGLFEILMSVRASGKSDKVKKDILGKGVKNTVKVGDKTATRNLSDSDKQKAEEIINNAIRSLNMSATSVYHLANLAGESYRECLQTISDDFESDREFTELYGISANNVISLLDHRALNESILDVIVQNSKPNVEDTVLFA